MWKGCFFAVLLCMLSMPVMAAGSYIPKQFSNTSTGDGMYPYSLNNRRNENVSVKKNNIPGIGGAAPMQQTGKRGVVKRPTLARAATQSQNNSRRVVPRANAARSAANTGIARSAYGNSRTIDNRGVVARGTSMNKSVRSTNPRREINTQTTTSSAGVSSQKCFANYKECMEMYCKREDTAYNRCFCSAKLAQIDSKYKSKIDSLVQQIIELQYKVDDDEDFDVVEYWNETVKPYSGTNPWVELKNALDIKWADIESRVRGQNAFNTGHQYCVNYLRSCSYMASNMRDAYKSEITRDCAAYESTLQKIQTAAESVIANYDK